MRPWSVCCPNEPCFKSTGCTKNTVVRLAKVFAMDRSFDGSFGVLKGGLPLPRRLKCWTLPLCLPSSLQELRHRRWKSFPHTAASCRTSLVRQSSIKASIVAVHPVIPGSPLDSDSSNPTSRSFSCQGSCAEFCCGDFTFDPLASSSLLVSAQFQVLSKNLGKGCDGMEHVQEHVVKFGRSTPLKKC